MGGPEIALSILKKGHVELDIAISPCRILGTCNVVFHITISFSHVNMRPKNAHIVM